MRVRDLGRDVSVLGDAVADDGRHGAAVPVEAAVEQRVLRPGALGPRHDAAAHLLDRITAELGDLALRHGRDERALVRLGDARGGVDEDVVLGQVEPVLRGAVQDRRVPDDAARVVAPERREQPAVVRPHVGEAAEDPGRNGNHVAGLADDLAVVAVRSPAERPRAAEHEEHFGGEVDVQVVRDAVRHGGGADVEAVRLAQVDDLVAARRHAGADQGVVLLEVRAGRLAVDEGDRAGHVFVPADQAPAGLVGRHGHVVHDRLSLLKRMRASVAASKR